MGMMIEPSPSIDDELDGGVVEREDTQHARLLSDDRKADAARVNTSRHLKWLAVNVLKTMSIVAKVITA